MSFNPNHLLNNPVTMLSHPGLMSGLDNGREAAAPVPPPPFDKGLYLDAYSRLGLLSIENVADLGCGAGNFVAIMTAKGMRPEMYVGIDHNHQRISTAKAAYPGWKFIYGDMRDERVRAEYERYGAFLMLNLVDTLEDDLDFLAGLPEGKPLVFSIPKMEMEGSRLCLTESNEIRDRYSSILRIRTVGRYHNSGTGQGWSVILASKW
jgi:SAM-dependent methyltransferase